jgi:hypothetical protein
LILCQILILQGAAEPVGLTLVDRAYNCFSNSVIRRAKTVPKPPVYNGQSFRNPVMERLPTIRSGTRVLREITTLVLR